MSTWREPSQTITVYPDRTCNTWMARYHDHPEIIRLFGCDVLPTAYTLHAPSHLVRRTLETRYPGARVRLIELDGTTHED